MYPLDSFPLWFLILPILCLASGLIGWFHYSQFNKESPLLHDSIAALCSYTKESLVVFFKKQFLFIGCTLVALVGASLFMQVLNVHHTLLTGLIVWGVLWSCVLGFLSLRKSASLSGSLLQLYLTQKDSGDRNIARLSWAFTLIPLALLLFDLWLWIMLIFAALHHNWLGLDMAHAASGFMEHEVSLVLLAYCFGALIQTFLVRMTTQTMQYSAQRATHDLAFNYPGLAGYDLRSPLSMSSHMSAFAHHIWGQLSRITNLVLLVLLSALVIAVTAFREDPGSYGNFLMKLPLLLFGIALIGAGISSLFQKASLRLQVYITSAVIGLGAIGIYLMGILPAYLLCIALVSIGLGLLLVSVHTKGTAASHDLTGILAATRRTWLTLFFVIIWIGFTFLFANGHSHILLGLHGLAFGALTLLSVGLPLIAGSFKQSWAQLCHKKAKLLDSSTPEIDTSESSRSSLFRTVLTTISCLVLFFVFLDSIPHWMTQFPAPLGTRPLTFMEIDFALGIAPTNIIFILGFFLSIAGFLATIQYWLRTVKRIEEQNKTEAQEQLDRNPDLLEGLTLPSYKESITTLTRHSFKASIGMAAFLVIQVLVVGICLGVAGLSGLVFGMIFLTLLLGVGSHLFSFVSSEKTLSMAYSIVALSTQTLILLSILFGALLLHFGGLIS